MDVPTICYVFEIIYIMETFSNSISIHGCSLAVLCIFYRKMKQNNACTLTKSLSKKEQTIISVRVYGNEYINIPDLCTSSSSWYLFPHV